MVVEDYRMDITRGKLLTLSADQLENAITSNQSELPFVLTLPPFLVQS